MQEAVGVTAVQAADERIICSSDGGYSPVHHLGMWCFVMGSNQPAHGLIVDAKSVLSCNIMEYVAVIKLLKSAEEGARLLIRSDSKLIVNQLTLKWNINFDHLRELFEEARSLIIQKSLHVAFQWIPREDNPAGKFIEDNHRDWFRRCVKHHAEPSESVKADRLEDFLEEPPEPDGPAKPAKPTEPAQSGPARPSGASP